MKTFGLIATTTVLLAFSHASFAKRTAAEEAAKRAAQQAKKDAKASSTSSNSGGQLNQVTNADRIRLEAKFEPDEVAGAEVENGKELKVRFESGKKLRLDAEAENFPEGSSFSVIVGGVNIGSITVALTSTGLIEGEISFRANNWPAGLPQDIPSGTIVEFLDASGASIASGPLMPK